MMDKIFNKFSGIISCFLVITYICFFDHGTPLVPTLLLIFVMACLDRLQAKIAADGDVSHKS